MAQGTTAQQGAQSMQFTPNGTQPQQGTQQPTTQLVSQNPTALKRMSEETVGQVLSRVNAMQDSGELVMPAGYNAGNALKSAWLYLQTIVDKNGAKAIDSCTKESIVNCLLEMCVKGEYPGNQCYFIVYKNTLQFHEKYTGKLMRAKRDSEIANVYPQVVYENDEFVYTVDELGRYQFVSHKTSIDNIDIAKIKSAYAVVVCKNGDKYLEAMTMEQIRKAWEQSPTGGKSPAHRNFTDQMCKKTVIARACKVPLESAPSSWSANKEEENDYYMDEAEAERQLANSGGARAALRNSIPDAFEVNAEYEDATDAAPDNAMPATKAPTAKGRECPV